MSELIVSLQLPELTFVKDTKVQDVLPKLLEFVVKGASAQLKEQCLWFIRFTKVTPFCGGSGPFIVRVNIELDVTDDATLSQDEIVDLVEEVLVGHWNFNLDEMENKIPPYWS